MKTCTHCGTHVKTADCTCPHCGTKAACRSARTPAVALLGLALAGCTGKADDTGAGDTSAALDTSDTATNIDTGGGGQADYGVPDTDEDADGYGVYSGDCDDTNAAVYPGAPETPGDGVDSNCDGNDDT
jgi:hypothetical protein